MVLLSAQGLPVAKIAEVSFTSDDRVRDVIHNFNTDGFDSLYPKYSGGRPKTFTLPERREIKKIAKSKPTEHDLPFSTWSLTKLADFLVAEGVVDDISHEGLRILLREEGVSFQCLKTWKTSRDPDYAAKKARVEHLYAIADGEVIPEDGEPEVIFCLDEFGPLNLMPHPGRQWAERGSKHKNPDREPRRRRRAVYNRYGGVRHLFAALDLADLAKDKLYGHIKPIKRPTQFLEFCRYLRTLYPPTVRIAIVCDNFSPHLTTKRCQRVGTWAAANKRRDRLHPYQLIVTQPHRGPIHGPALLHPRRHRPRRPQGTGQHDPPLHHLPEQPRCRPTPPHGRGQSERRLNPTTPAFTTAGRAPTHPASPPAEPDRPAMSSPRTRRLVPRPRFPTTR
ncbi:IS630 family transposase [Streptomyces scopuliridis]|nr:IS630 family transposase [Streptomyces scopuliridis]